MTPRRWTFFALASSLLAACGEVVIAPDPGDTSLPDTTTSTTPPASTSTATSTGGQGGGGAEPGFPADCPVEIPAPPDCGAYAATCAGAVPIAGGGDVTRATGLALDAKFAYWFAATPAHGGCNGVIYRSPRAGGPATRFAYAPSQMGFEVDDKALYVLERPSGAYEIRAFDTTTGVATHLGPIAAPSSDTYKIASTPAGVVAYSWSAWAPSFLRVATQGITAIATEVGPDGYLGSVPSFDGQSLFFSWSPPLESSDVDTVVGVPVGGTITTELGKGATTRQWPSVVASGADVFFVTGDPSTVFGEVPYPMGVSRVAKTGGAPAVLVQPGSVMIDQLVVDATDVYFSVSALLTDSLSYAIQSVPRAGGPLRTVWKSDKRPDSLREDGDSLYFSLQASEIVEIPDGTDLGPGGFVVRVPKSSSVF
jgi:hypothetical protein